MERGFSLPHVDPSATPGFNAGRQAGRAELAVRRVGTRRTAGEAVRGEQRPGVRRVLLVLQGMDTSGKDGVVNTSWARSAPIRGAGGAFQACRPSEELAHDFLWRIEQAGPPAGPSAYSTARTTRTCWSPGSTTSARARLRRRYGQITTSSSGWSPGHHHREGHAPHQRSGAEGPAAARLDEPTKHWKYNPGDLDVRADWAPLREAYQLAVWARLAPEAPWYVVPANHKWYARLAVQRLLLRRAARDASCLAGRRLRRGGGEAAYRRRARGSTAYSNASRMGRNFIRVSTSSCSATDSATIPAPACAVTVPSEADLGAAQSDRPLAVAVGADPPHGPCVPAAVERLKRVDEGRVLPVLAFRRPRPWGAAPRSGRATSSRL